MVSQGWTTKTFRHEDRFVDHDAARVHDELVAAAALGFHGNPGIDLARKRLGRIDLGNPATASLIERYPGFGHWLNLVPTAAALEPLYDPSAENLPNGRPIDVGTRKWFCNIADGRGIRSRAAALQHLLAQDQHQDPKWLSLASGAARPVIESAVAKRDTAEEPTVDLIDLDRNALKAARERATHHGLLQLHTHRANVLRPSGIRAHKVEKLSYSIVDAVGLLEYLRADDWGYRYRGVVRGHRRAMAGAITFLRNAYELVRPGGLLIFGNMLDSHPELAFTLNVVQWPHIQPRSIHEVKDIVAKADLAGEAEVHLPDDGVYALYVIRRPH
jgi:hypothetical protein